MDWAPYQKCGEDRMTGAPSTQLDMGMVPVMQSSAQPEVSQESVPSVVKHKLYKGIIPAMSVYTFAFHGTIEEVWAVAIVIFVVHVEDLKRRPVVPGLDLAHLGLPLIGDPDGATHPRDEHPLLQVLVQEGRKLSRIRTCVQIKLSNHY